MRWMLSPTLGTYCSPGTDPDAWASEQPLANVNLSPGRWPQPLPDNGKDVLCKNCWPFAPIANMSGIGRSCKSPARSSQRRPHLGKSTRLKGRPTMCLPAVHAACLRRTKRHAPHHWPTRSGPKRCPASSRLAPALPVLPLPLLLQPLR